MTARKSLRVVDFPDKVPTFSKQHSAVLEPIGTVLGLDVGPDKPARARFPHARAGSFFPIFEIAYQYAARWRASSFQKVVANGDCAINESSPEPLLPRESSAVLAVIGGASMS